MKTITTLINEVNETKAAIAHISFTMELLRKQLEQKNTELQERNMAITEYFVANPPEDCGLISA